MPNFLQWFHSHYFIHSITKPLMVLFDEDLKADSNINYHTTNVVVLKLHGYSVYYSQEPGLLKPLFR